MAYNLHEMYCRFVTPPPHSYPFFECPVHGKQRSLVICEHVLRGAAIAYYEHATDFEMGEMLCARDHAPHTLSVICAAHAQRFLGSLQ